MKKLIARDQRRTWLRSLVVLFVGLFVLSTVAPAYASGRVIWKSTTIKERTKNESWRLEMQIHLSSAPDVGSKSMKFEFTQIAEFERELVDGREGPQSRTTALTGQQSLIETVMVGFNDPGTGKTMNRTKFSFKVTRAHGYRAGKWKVKIKDADSGRQIGSVSTITLNGENEVVDRRSITFQGKKKDDDDEANDDGPPEQQEAPAPVEEEMYMGEPDEEGAVPPSVDGKPGGGCHHSPLGESPLGAWLFAFGAGALLLARRRV